MGNLRQGVIQFFSAITGLQAALFALATLLNGEPFCPVVLSCTDTAVTSDLVGV